MRRSTFEVQIGILNALAQCGPLKLTHIMYNANLNCNGLKQLLDHLIKNGLVEEQKLRKKRKLYSITEKGQRALEYTRKIDTSLPVMETIRI
jgi:predicted transcriptional regulator